MASHTATGEWQSFELRMRRRRAERLVLRADVAAEAGCYEDARGLIDEARALWSAVPGLPEVEQKLDRAIAQIDEQPATSHWKEVIAAAVALICIGTAGAVIVFEGPGSRDQGPGTRHQEPPPVIQQPVTEFPKATPAIPSPRLEQPNVERAAVTDSNAPVSDAPHPEPRSLVSDSRSPAPDPGSLIPVPRSVAPDPDVVPATTSVAVPPPPAAVPALAASSSPAIPVASNTAPLQPPQELLVNSVLARYAKAYSDLDVDAAERVWPTVNRQALTRAFDSLESQRVAFDQCHVQVDGNAARASCAGSATWTPKVGGREHTDARSWIFDLEKSAGGWQITSARVQNR